MQTQSPPSPSTTLYSQHRRPSCRHRRTTRPTTAGGLCASCLRERLAGFDATNYRGISNHSVPRFVADNLHRSKSHREFNCGAAARSSAEPRRRSCEVVGGTSPIGLLNLEDGPGGRDGSSGSREGNEEGGIRICDSDVEQNEEVDNGGVHDDFEGGAELRTVREFIDLEWERKKRRNKDLRGFWGVAAVLTDKWRKWRRREKITNRGPIGLVNGGNVAIGEEGVDKDKANVGELGDMRSEVGECGIGRRSCDLELVNGGRISYDVPRASLDGHMTGRSSMYQHLNPAVSAVNDVKLVDDQSEDGVLVEEKLGCVYENGKSPGGRLQTRYYYKESPALQRRRRSFERSNSHKSAEHEFEVDEAKLLLRSKPSPAAMELFNGTKLLITEQELMDWRLKSVKQDDLATLESAFQNAAPFVGRQDQKRCKKLQLLGWRKAWNTWSLMHSRGEKADVDRRISCVAGELDTKLVVTESRQERNNVAKKDEPIGNISQRLKLSNSVTARSKSAESYGDNIDNVLRPVYLAPLRTSRSKSERMKAVCRKEYYEAVTT
ncbi:protein OCTOPUS-like [Rhodamnia argentea]|uniref:Protein OCTOPUS-like n=1 Tax=Rhodamnia argentea TaxID=178133 RepID=A0ABM3HK48_9MYRT|nr:protein OCTOPUS-like [Rhodamnia argentea]